MNFKMMITKIAILLVILASFTQCASSQNIDTVSPVTIEESYFQKWVAGRKEAGSGFTIHLSIKKNDDVVLNHAYFKGKKIELKLNNKAVYVGRYTYPNKTKDLIMSDDPQEEFRNTAPIIEEKIPFELKENECVITYTKDKKEGFFKIDDLPEKPKIAMPMRREQ